MDAPVVDRTGLAGIYQFTLDLPRDAMFERISTELNARLGGVPQGLATPAGGVSVVKTIEGLGLRLERRRVPMDVIVVDKIARTPTEN